jgi:hypothetical protein
MNNTQRPMPTSPSSGTPTPSPQVHSLHPAAGASVGDGGSGARRLLAAFECAGYGDVDARFFEPGTRGRTEHFYGSDVHC